MEPYDQLRACVEDMTTFDLQERTGMLCEYLQEELERNGVDFEGARFFKEIDEPYEAAYYWDFEDKTLDVVIRSGQRQSDWTVTKVVDGRKRWMKGKLVDFESSVKDLVKELK